MLKCYIPSNLDWEAIFERHPNTLNTKKREDVCNYICGQFTYLAAIYREDIYKNGTDLIPLCTRYLKPIIHDYHRYLDYLVEACVLVTDNHFKNEDECRGYQFAEIYRGTGLVKVELANLIIRRNIKGFKAKRTEEKKVKLKPYPYLTKWFKSGKLECNLPLAEKWISEFEEAVFNYYMKTSSTGNAHQDSLVKKRLKEKADGFRMMCSFFTDEDYHLMVDDAGGRFYSLLTNMKKELREFITYAGQYLVSLDIKNSQPYLLSLILQESFWKNEGEGLTLKKIDLELYNKLRENSNAYKHIITLLQSPKSLFQTGYSPLRFIELVCTGNLYEFLLKEFKGKYFTDADDRFATRDKVKQEVMRILYFDPRRSLRGFYAPYKQFKVMFPVVAKVLEFLKSENYKNLPILLQAIEARCVLKEIGGGVSKEKPDMPFYTIHDSCITTVGNEDYLEAVMHEKLAALIGWAPKIKPEYWKPENAFNKLADKEFLDQEVGKLYHCLMEKR